MIVGVAKSLKTICRSSPEGITCLSKRATRHAKASLGVLPSWPSRSGSLGGDDVTGKGRAHYGGPATAISEGDHNQLTLTAQFNVTVTMDVKFDGKSHFIRR